MDKYLGKRLEGRYDILELIGSGGMANVYRAHDVIDDRTVAVKILRDEFIGNNEFIRRFKNESKAIALLNHPNIVRVYDVSFTNNIHSIVMEYIDGITLKEFIQHKGILSPKEALHFTTQILNALQHAHDKGIVHRDIKPQNIMLLRSGQIKVTDFGIARFARSEVRTITDRAIGSVHYISPEQAMGENTDEKSDIYSVGVMLYEMLTGQLPFEGDTAVSVAIKQVQTDPVSPRSVNPSIPAGLEEIIMRAMEKDPEDRYQSAAEMIADIRAFQQDPKIRFHYQAKKRRQAARRQAREDKESRVATKPKKRTPYLKMLFIVTLAISIGSAGFVGLMLYLNNPFKRKAEEEVYDMIGQRLEEVESKHYPYQLDVNYVYDNSVPYGVIIEQRPQAGMKVMEGRSVKVSVSQGPESVTIPDYIGTPASRTIRELQDLGMVAVQADERQFNDEIPAGAVISMNPTPGEVVQSGTEIQLVVSKGTEIIPITVPDIRDMNIESAKSQLQAAGFRIGRVHYKQDNRPEDIVISQTPAPGSLQLEGTEISITVSEGGLLTYTVEVPLPLTMNREVLFRARTGEEAETIADESTFNPAEMEGDFWYPSFSGTEEDQLKITIYVDKELYQQYELDFSTGRAWLVYDRSDDPYFD